MEMVRLTSRARPPAAPRVRVQAPRGRFATPGLVPKGLNQSHSEKVYWVSQKKGRFGQIGYNYSKYLSSMCTEQKKMLLQKVSHLGYSK